MDMKLMKRIVWIFIWVSLIVLLGLTALFISSSLFDMQNYSGDTKWVNVDRYVISKYIGSDDKFYFLVSDPDNASTDTVEVSERSYNSYDVGDWYDTTKVLGTELIDPNERILDFTTRWIPRVLGILVGLTIVWIVLRKKVDD